MRITQEEFDALQIRFQNHASCRQIRAQQTQSPNTTNGAGEKPDAENGQLEGKLQARIEKYLRGLGSKCFWFHDRSRHCNVPGLPDLLIWLEGGRFVAMELKVKGGKMSAEQVRTQQRLLYLGFEVHEIRSFKQAIEVLNGK